MLLQQFGNDFVFLLKLGFQFFDLNRISILLTLGIGLVRFAIEGSLTVLEQLLLPIVKIDDTDAVLIADLRDWHFFKQVLPQNRYLLFWR